MCYAGKMGKECEDKVEIVDYDLPALSLKQLKELFAIVCGCEDCRGCDLEKKLLLSEIEAKDRK